MKTQSILVARSIPIAAFLLAVAGMLFSGTASAPCAEQPVIKSVRVADGEITIVADIPPGLRKAVLQSRTRMPGSSWIPRGIFRLATAVGGEVTFKTSATERIEFLRVQAEASDPLPEAFYLGTNEFNGEIAAGPVEGVPPAKSPFDAAVGGPEDRSNEAREVVESDIWKIEGNRLYFYNQFRGLQIIDISNPSAPARLGVFPLPAAGEQMYVVDSHAVLLARNNCYQQGGNDSKIVIVNIADGGAPALAASMPVEGYITESRMIGTALYIASETYRTRIEGGTTVWEWGTVVSSFDLSNPAAPVARDTRWVSGYGNTVTATDQFLFVSAIKPTDYWRSDIYCFDITSPTGEIISLSTVSPAGRVDDKFKINLSKDLLTTISIRWENGRGWSTWLENFDFSNPGLPAKVGQIQLAQGEQLHATRFDGDKVYIVTFFRVDPLWIVDLSDAARPRIVGELEVPGWSTYIHPWGDRLVTIGIDPSSGWRVAVSLFNVENPAKPALLDKELLGQNYSWSEATYDEKAFNVLTDAGLILLPYSGNVSSNGWAQQVQLIDLATNSLAVRGAIDHQFQPRRATLASDHILSISSRELVSVSAEDRDHPLLQANLELSWPVERVFLAGDYLLEIESGSSWWWHSSESPTVVRVASTAAPEQILAAVNVPDELQLAGADFRDGYLYLLQSRSFYEYPVVLGAGGALETRTNFPAMRMTVFDARNLPELRIVGSHTHETTNLFWGNFEAIWVETNVLVWAGAAGGYWWWWRGPIDILPAVSAPGASAPRALSVAARPWIWGTSGNGRFFAFDAENPAEPKLLSDLWLNPTNRWNFSAALHEGPLVFISDQSWEYVPTNSISGHWISRSFLNVIDYSDPSWPAVRKPVNIPGALKGLSHNGRIIYTAGPRWTDRNETDWHDWIDACAYDDVEVHLLDSLYAGPPDSHPYVLQDGSVFLAKSGTESAPGALSFWKLSTEGKFTLRASTELGLQTHMLALIQDVLVVRDNYSALLLFDAGSETTLRKLGQAAEPNCLWHDIEFTQGSQADGLWLPLRDYGIWNIPIAP